MTDEIKKEKEEPLPVKIMNQKVEKDYDGEESYQYEDLKPTKEELMEDFEE